jgi:ATP/maltotriose-dependent transcriptional regulator MalT
LRTAPHTQLIATPRERLNMRGERLYVVKGMDSAAVSSAVRLFVQRCACAASFKLSNVDLPHVLRICALVQGMPQGLELAADVVSVAFSHAGAVGNCSSDAGMGLVGCAEVLYEWNDLACALHAATQGIELLRGTVERRLLVRGYIVLAQARQAQADHDAALESIRRCEEWFAQTQIGAPQLPSGV